MLREFYAGSGLMFWPMLGMGILAVTFVAVMAWTIFGLRRSPVVSRMARLPLERDEPADGAEEVRNDG